MFGVPSAQRGREIKIEPSSLNDGDDQMELIAEMVACELKFDQKWRITRGRLSASRFY